MPNPDVTLDHDDQKVHLLLALLGQLQAIGMTLGALSRKTADPTYNDGAVNDLILEQAEISSRIDEIKADGPFTYPSDDQVKALGQASDALAAIDLEAAAAIAVVDAINGVIAALPAAATKG